MVGKDIELQKVSEYWKKLLEVLYLGEVMLNMCGDKENG